MGHQGETLDISILEVYDLSQKETHQIKKSEHDIHMKKMKVATDTVSVTDSDTRVLREKIRNNKKKCE